MRTNLPVALRVLRTRRGWRQADLAARAGVSRELVSRVERGLVDGVPAGVLDRLARSLGAGVSLTVWWQGERLDRLADEAHAALQAAVAGRLAALSWETWAEASFNRFGERGRFDVLAHEPRSRCLLAVEVKTAFGDLQDTLGRLDAKVRLAPVLAAERGWLAPRAVPMLVVTDTRAARRVVAAHAPLFAGFDVRGRAALAWLRRPTGVAPHGLLWFAKRPDSHGATITRRSRVRVPAQTDGNRS